MSNENFSTYSAERIKRADKCIREIINYFSEYKCKVLNSFTPLIILKEEKLEYVYPEEVNNLLDWIDKECENKVKEIYRKFLPFIDEK